MSNKDFIAIVLIGAVIIFGIYRGSIWLFNLLTEEPDLSGDIPEPSQNALSFEKPYYKGLADSIEEELSTLFIGFGTPTVVYDILNQMQSQEDLNQLIISFGVRGSWWVLGDSRERNLIQWLHRRLTDSQRQPIKEKFNSFNIPF